MTAPISASYYQKTRESKPAFPYLVGTSLTLRSHQPPSPPPFASCAHNYHTARERESVHPLKRCLLRPPLPGKHGQVTAELQITRTIRAGDNTSAQVVAVRVQSSSSNNLPKDTDLMAKIYDPLYFDHDQDDADPFLAVESAYSHETAAYKALSILQGGVIPKYFGSFSMKIRAGPTAFRSVGLILIERIQGCSMQQLSPVNLSQLIRQTIMKTVIDTESLIYTHNIIHRDLRPANVLVRNDTEARRIVIIDFGKCVLGRHPVPELRQKYLPGVPISPLLRWHEPRQKFQPWIDWAWEPWLEHVYGSTRASITENMKSLWLPPPPPIPRPPPAFDD